MPFLLRVTNGGHVAPKGNNPNYCYKRGESFISPVNLALRWPEKFAFEQELLENYVPPIPPGMNTASVLSSSVGAGVAVNLTPPVKPSQENLRETLKTLTSEELVKMAQDEEIDLGKLNKNSKPQQLIDFLVTKLA